MNIFDIKYGGRRYDLPNGSYMIRYPGKMIIWKLSTSSKYLYYNNGKRVNGQCGPYILDERETQVFLNITNCPTFVMNTNAVDKGFVEYVAQQPSQTKPVALAANAVAPANRTVVANMTATHPASASSALISPSPVKEPANITVKVPNNHSMVNTIPKPVVPAPAPKPPVPAPASAPKPPAPAPSIDVKPKGPDAIPGDHDTKGKLPLTEGYKCGVDNGNTHCPNGMCCGKDGICGTDRKFCQDRDCAKGWGHCEGVMEAKDMEGRCGLAFGGRQCAKGECCSAFSWCGKGELFCYAQQPRFSNL
jgi:hypothetical protein